mmetsp:Transcript_31439/g.37439  ORF Transcript_31439/g.37439 Transcript_31439/m.37439 type:complete len:86 (+) Transcript_31439:3-260(+)
MPYNKNSGLTHHHHDSSSSVGSSSSSSPEESNRIDPIDFDTNAPYLFICFAHHSECACIFNDDWYDEKWCLSLSLSSSSSSSSSS